MSRDPGNPWFKLDYARLLTRIGDRAGGDRVITTMVAVPNPSGDTLAAAAIWYGEHGDYQDAAKYAARVPSTTRVGEFAAMEHQWMAERDAHQAVLLAQHGRLGEAHRRLAIKLADQARLQGDYAGAYDRLSPELAVSRDATVLAALGRIYDSAGRHKAAIEIYTRILRSDPSNMDARREIIGAAIVIGDYERARGLLR